MAEEPKVGPVDTPHVSLLKWLIDHPGARFVANSAAYHVRSRGYTSSLCAFRVGDIICVEDQWEVRLNGITEVDEESGQIKGLVALEWEGIARAVVDGLREISVVHLQDGWHRDIVTLPAESDLSAPVENGVVFKCYVCSKTGKYEDFVNVDTEEFRSSVLVCQQCYANGKHLE